MVVPNGQAIEVRKPLIDKNTLVPIGVVVAIVLSVVASTWGMATDRQAQVGRIDQLEKQQEIARKEIIQLRDQLNDMEHQLYGLVASVDRIEKHLGTKP